MRPRLAKKVCSQGWPSVVQVYERKSTPSCSVLAGCPQDAIRSSIRCPSQAELSRCIDVSVSQPDSKKAVNMMVMRHNAGFRKINEFAPYGLASLILRRRKRHDEVFVIFLDRSNLLAVGRKVILRVIGTPPAFSQALFDLRVGQRIRYIVIDGIHYYRARNGNRNLS